MFLSPTACRVAGAVLASAAFAVTQTTLSNSSPRAFADDPSSSFTFFIAAPDLTTVALYAVDWSVMPVPSVTELRRFPAGPSAVLMPEGLVVTPSGRLFFAADDGTGAGRELWTSLGSPASTVPIDVASGAPSSSPAEIRPVPSGAGVYFAARDGARGEELWFSNGTGAGTVLIADIETGPADSSPRDLTVLPNGDVIFSAFRATAGRELFRASSAPGTAALVADIRPGPASSGPTDLFVLGPNDVVFSADNGVTGREPWRTDVVSTTAPLLDLAPGAADSAPRSFARRGGELAFVADDGVRGDELVLFSLATSTRIPVAEVRAGPIGGGVRELLAVGNRLFFNADDGVTGAELWALEPTRVVSRVADLRTGPIGSSPENLIVRGGRLLFTADDGVAGRELWSVPVDTSTAPALVRDLRPGAAGAQIAEVFGADAAGAGLALFGANGDPTIGGAAASRQGLELYRSDGTALGTLLLADLQPGNDLQPELLGTFAQRGANADFEYRVVGGPAAGFGAIVFSTGRGPSVRVPGIVGPLQLAFPLIGTAPAPLDQSGQATLAFSVPLGFSFFTLGAQALVGEAGFFALSNVHIGEAGAIDLTGCACPSGWSLCSASVFVDDGYYYRLEFQPTGSVPTATVTLSVCEGTAGACDAPFHQVELVGDSEVQVIEGFQAIGETDRIEVRLQCGADAPSCLLFELKC
ncbi:MAG: hypothetical protein AAF628_03215 [Planctomycetota bacterium]